MGTKLKLTSLAGSIRHFYAASRRAIGKSLLHAKRCGQMLLKAKAQVQHGGWLEWLKKNCPEVQPWTAQAYMRIADEWSRIESQIRDGHAFGIKQALQLLTDNRDPEQLEKTRPLRGLLTQLSESEQLERMQRDEAPVFEEQKEAKQERAPRPTPAPVQMCEACGRPL